MVDNERKILVINSESMGENVEIGQKLLRACIHTLNDVEIKPKIIILYNAGVKLFTHPQTYADLEALMRADVKIISCKTCLSYFEIVNHLGSAVNMLEIMEIVTSTNKIIYL